MHLIAVHGYPLDRRLWSPLGELAAEGALGKGISLLAPDLRGRGASRRSAAKIHTMALLADDLAEDVAESLPKDEPFVLAGLSMGGYVAFEFLKRHSARFHGRLRGLVLCDTRASGDDEAGRAKRREAIEAIRAHGIEAALNAMLPKLLPKGARGTAVEEMARAMILATPPRTACADLAGMAVRDEGFDALAAYRGPLLLVVGEEDVLTPPADSEAMAAAAGNAPFIRLFTVPGAGHLAPLEKPRDVAGPIADLLRRAA